jgi:hypothetical protein
MEELIKNVTILQCVHNGNSIDYELEISKEEKVWLTNCHLTHHPQMSNETLFCLQGNCEQSKDEIHYLKGILHVYGKPFLSSKNKCDLLLIKSDLQS